MRWAHCKSVRPRFQPQTPSMSVSRPPAETRARTPADPLLAQSSCGKFPATSVSAAGDCRRYGHSKKNTPARSNKFFFHRGVRYSVMGPFVLGGGFLDCCIVEGGFTSARFYQALIMNVVRQALRPVSPQPTARSPCSAANAPCQAPYHAPLLPPPPTPPSQLQLPYNTLRFRPLVPSRVADAVQLMLMHRPRVVCSCRI